MPKYECPKCNKVFCGWSVKYKYKNKCPNCGSDLRKVNSNSQRSRRGLTEKVFKVRERNGLRKS